MCVERESAQVHDAAGTNGQPGGEIEKHGLEAESLLSDMLSQERTRAKHSKRSERSIVLIKRACHFNDI